jgi:hypothetical protein
LMRSAQRLRGILTTRRSGATSPHAPRDRGTAETGPDGFSRSSRHPPRQGRVRPIPHSAPRRLPSGEVHTLVGCSRLWCASRYSLEAPRSAPRATRSRRRSNAPDHLETPSPRRRSTSSPPRAARPRDRACPHRIRADRHHITGKASGRFFPCFRRRRPRTLAISSAAAC